MQNTTLYTLFMPPKDCCGDFGLICGFTATPQVLGQIRRTFAGEMARPVLAAFIHPTVNAVSDVPELAWMWMQLKNRGYNLLHAKVALLGFRRRKKDDGYVLRLAVSTGNWTQDPLTDSIDLFWLIDVDTADAKDQDIADTVVREAKDDLLDDGQRASVAELARRIRAGGRSVLLADEVGMGKKRIAAALIHAVRKANGRSAIILPPGLGVQWQQELRRFNPDDQTLLPLRSYDGFIAGFMQAEDAEGGEKRRRSHKEWLEDRRQQRELPTDSWAAEKIVMISHSFANPPYDPLKNTTGIEPIRREIAL